MLNKTNKCAMVVVAGLAGLFGATPGAYARIDESRLDLPSPRTATQNLRSAADLMVLRLAPRALVASIEAPAAPVAATVPLPARPSAPDYNVFRSTVVPVGKLPAFGQWAEVRRAAEPVGDLCGGEFCATRAGRRLADAVAAAEGLPEIDALRLINRAVNRAIAYRSDSGDDWASLARSAARGTGDCEDFAIAKLTLLRRLGFAPEQLQFVALKDTRRQLFHAVLAVHLGGKRYILDNLSDTVAGDELYRSYLPIASFVGDKTFIHGFAGKQSGFAALGKGGLGAIRLGEGN